MKKIMLLYIVFLSACVYDKINKIIVVKNNSKHSFILVYGIDNISDSLLYFGRMYVIKADTTQNIYGPSYIEKKNNVTFWLFNHDTVYNQINSGVIRNIVKKSFVKKYIVSGDSLKNYKVVLNIP